MGWNWIERELRNIRKWNRPSIRVFQCFCNYEFEIALELWFLEVNTWVKIVHLVSRFIYKHSDLEKSFTLRIGYFQRFHSVLKNNQGEGIIFKATIIFKVCDSKKSFPFSMLKSSILMPDSNPAWKIIQKSLLREQFQLRFSQFWWWFGLPRSEKKSKN